MFSLEEGFQPEWNSIMDEIKTSPDARRQERLQRLDRATPPYNVFGLNQDERKDLRALPIFFTKKD